MVKRTTNYIISWIFGVLFIILLVFIVNIISLNVSTPFAADLTSFLNSNLILLIFISLMFFLGALFFHIGFPVSLLTPIFDAFGGAFLVSLLISLIVLVEEYVPIGIGSFLENISIIISALVFVAIILFGYMSVLSESHRKRHRHFPERRSHEEVTEEIEEEEPVSEKPKRKRRVVRRRVTR